MIFVVNAMDTVSMGIALNNHHYSDGSVENDLPMKQLGEFFNVNHFIVSQVKGRYGRTDRYLTHDYMQHVYVG